ncbi:hypothetical protein GCM10025865_08400 [Paraoerskovia sediminicola]|uniref:4-hydroxybenzoate polyprenyltransferase n=1 Tax=Paraoerskovia sediminicola TaxID=1138587 RepID=A0ABM8G0G4_9CELL|nr:hypothetical protein GCM10025865_08400 [Paraoerskovia sediminicola]
MTADARTPDRYASLRAVVAASRPFSWVNTAYPFAAGYLVATGGRIDLTLVLGTIYFLVPYNLLMYGINDVFDYESDLRNPRKGGIEGGLVDRKVARATHRRILLAAVATNLPFLVWLLSVGDLAANLVLTVVVFLVIAYSAPGLRFKERAFVDSFTSAMHFVGPLLYALVLVGAPLGARDVWPVLVAFVLWGPRRRPSGPSRTSCRTAPRAWVRWRPSSAPGAPSWSRARPTCSPGSCCWCCPGRGCWPQCSRCRTW